MAWDDGHSTAAQASPHSCAAAHRQAGGGTLLGGLYTGTPVCDSQVTPELAGTWALVLDRLLPGPTLLHSANSQTRNAHEVLCQ